jgi:hypothetical protein
MFNHGRLASALKAFTVKKHVIGFGALTLTTIFPAFGGELLTVNSSHEAMSARLGGMPYIQEDELSGVTAFGISEDIAYLQNVANQTGPDDDVAATALMAIFEIAVPGFGLLSEYTVTGVEYSDPNTEKSLVNADGSITVVIPDRIAEIAFYDLSFGDSEDATPMGDLFFRDIRLIEGSRIILRPKN